MTRVDLSELRIDESAVKPKRPLGPRVLAAAVIALLVAVAATFLWPLLRPVRAVATAPVRAADVASPTSTVAVAEAVGWVEPEPYPVIVKPLVAGRVERIDVLEGHAVVAGETVLASLQSAALLAAHERAAATLAERESEQGLAIAKHEQAAANLRQHAEHRSKIADARVALAEKTTALTAARGNAERLTASARAATAARQAQESLTEAGTGHPVALERARAEADAADAAAATAAAEVATVSSELDAARERLALHQELYDEPVDLEAEVAVAAAEVERAARRRDAAATDLAIAERELDWSRRVLAPVDGVVMRLIASPGETTGPEGEGIVALYDPGRLQARLDVPLDSVAGIHPGQRVELRSEVTGNEVVSGKVLRIQHETDLLKNTLQVKVRLDDPPAIWRPETLCRARFLGSGGGAETPGAELTFLVPKAAVRGETVFVFDPARGTARAVGVTVVGGDGELSLVRGELSVAQRVITDEVEDGEAVEERER